jgi:hypothetical protein
MPPEHPLLFRINRYRPYVGFLVLLLLSYYYGPSQDLSTYFRYHDYNPVKAYASLPSSIPQLCIPLMLLCLLYVYFEPCVRYYATLFFWSEEASDEIVAKNKEILLRREEELKKALSRSNLGTSDSAAASR